MLAPLIALTFPKCFISGNLFRVTAIGYGSISLAQTGVIPHKLAVSGNPPEPSNKLPNFIVFISNVFLLFGLQGPAIVRF